MKTTSIQHSADISIIVGDKLFSVCISTRYKHQVVRVVTSHCASTLRGQPARRESRSSEHRPHHNTWFGRGKVLIHALQRVFDFLVGLI